MKHTLIGIVGVLVFAGAGGYLYSLKGDGLDASLLDKKEKTSVAVLHTNQGDIIMELYRDKVPELTKNFTELVRSGKYNGTIFHRVIDGFMIQGGDYERFNGTGGKSYTGGYLKDEIVPGLTHTRGVVSMANKGPNTNGSQFFIVQNDAKFLDGRHSIFGQVTEGMDIVDKIAKMPKDELDAPIERIVIRDIELR
jgi:cyclophilin family peptidyl-prolyl cis-trans isomerase